MSKHRNYKAAKSEPMESPPELSAQAAFIEYHVKEETMTVTMKEEEASEDESTAVGEEAGAHVESVHSTSSKKHTCSICGKYFKWSSSLKVHALLHTGELPYQCNVCDKAFSQSGSLKLHEGTHSG